MPNLEYYPFIKQIKELHKEFPGAFYLWLVLLLKGVISKDELREIDQYIRAEGQESQEAWENRPRSLMDRIFGL